jgi:hypothetical protein
MIPIAGQDQPPPGGRPVAPNLDDVGPRRELEGSRLPALEPSNVLVVDADLEGAPPVPAFVHRDASHHERPHTVSIDGIGPLWNLATMERRAMAPHKRNGGPPPGEPRANQSSKGSCSPLEDRVACHACTRNSSARKATLNASSA